MRTGCAEGGIKLESSVKIQPESLLKELRNEKVASSGNSDHAFSVHRPALV